MAAEHPLFLFGDLEDFVARGRRAQAVAEHLAVYGPGLTFGELAIGERFYHAPPLVALPGAHWPPPRGPCMTKTSATAYAWSSGPGGIGTAKDYYRVERA